MFESRPTLRDVNVYDSLDERMAAEHFLGKDLAQAEALFRENFLYYQEDLMWMGPRAFSFYVDAAIAYLLSGDARGDADAASSFCGVVEFQLESHGEAIAPARGKLREAIEAIVRDFALYDCDRLANGDLPSRYRRLLNHLG